MDMRETAIITGAAGGMGAAIARAFAEEGRDLILCDLQAGPLEELHPKLVGDAPAAAWNRERGGYDTGNAPGHGNAVYSGGNFTVFLWRKFYDYGCESLK